MGSVSELTSSEITQAIMNVSSNDLKPWEPLSPEQHTYVGVYLVIVGTLGVFDNALVVAMFIKFRRLLTPSNILLLNLCVTDLGICLLGGFLFSGTSSLSGRWLFGDLGCQYYAFMGFFFGNANILNLFMIALDRYLITCRQDLRERLTFKTYYQMLAFIYLMSLFWSVTPLLGWASYGFEPTVTTCTINWQQNDYSYKSYMMAFTVVVFVVPLILMCSCYYQAATYLRRARESGDNQYTYDWANETNINKMGVILVGSFLFCWSGYVVVCVWTVFRQPNTLPMLLTLLPPLMAKVGPVMNPIIYFYSHPKLRKGMIATLTCGFREVPPELLELPENKSMTGGK